jgi:hypothetical protein
MRSPIIVLSLFVALVSITAGCGSPGSGTGDAGGQPDAGTSPDAGGEPDAGGNPDAGTPVYDGSPIVETAETWTWVPFPDSICGYGSSTGLAINPTSRSNDVFIFMNGGGACWDEITCFGLPPLIPEPTAQYLSGYDDADFFSTNGFTSEFAVNRNEPTNPFKDMSYVFIPYCTGDVHAGDAIRTYGSRPQVHHKGAKNLEAFLERLVPTFPNATRIFLGGSSGGGFGAQLNYERVANALPNAEVHVFADSAQIINPIPARMSAWLAAWNVTLPADCVGCETNFALYPCYLATTYPDSRFALTAFDQDFVLVPFNGLLTAAEFQARTLALLDSCYDPSQSARYFLLSGNGHTMLGDLNTLVAPGGTSLLSFTTNWVNGTNWSSVR